LFAGAAPIIARVVERPGVVEYAKKVPHVSMLKRTFTPAPPDTQDKIVKAIKEKGLNRVVVASCSPRTHEPLFQDTIREAGLNKYLFEMANIRDQCSWVHYCLSTGVDGESQRLVHNGGSQGGYAPPAASIESGNNPKSINNRRWNIGNDCLDAHGLIAAQNFEGCPVRKGKRAGRNLKHIYLYRKKAPILRLYWPP